MSTIVHYRTANLQSCILYIYSTNIGTEYFKRGIYSPFFFKYSLFHNSNLFGSRIIHILYKDVLKLKKKKFRRQTFNSTFPESRISPQSLFSLPILSPSLFIPAFLPSMTATPHFTQYHSISSTR